LDSKLKILVGLVSVLLVATTFVGCAEQQTQQAEKQWPEQLLFRAGSSGSSWTVLANSLASQIEQNAGISMRVEPGGSFGNTIAICRGETDLALTQSAWMPIFGDPEKLAEFTEEKLDGSKIRIVANDVLGEFVLLVYAHPDFEANSIDDIINRIKEGKAVRIGVGGSTGSLESFIPGMLLEYYGLTLDDLKNAGGSLSITGASTAISQMMEGKIDVIVDIGTLGAAAYKELEVRMPNVKMIELPQEFRDYLT